MIDFTGEGKTLARADIVAEARARKAIRILDLWGGGASARAFTDALPDAEVVSCEAKEALWPDLMRDAQKHGYTPWCGNAKSVPGQFDFVWLDLCSQWSEKAEEVITEVCRTKLVPGATVAITILPERESFGLVTWARIATIPAAMIATTRRHLLSLRVYQRPNGHLMYLGLLGGSPGPIDILRVVDCVTASGIWRADPNVKYARAGGAIKPIGLSSGRPCASCSHELHAEIDRRLLAGASIISVSDWLREIGTPVSRNAVARHRTIHLRLKRRAA